MQIRLRRCHGMELLLNKDEGKHEAEILLIGLTSSVSAPLIL